MEYQTILDADAKYTDLTVSKKILQDKIKTLAMQKKMMENEISAFSSKITYMHLAEKILNEVVAKISQENLCKIESFVNQALSIIFPDLSLIFNIEQDVKRGNNTYKFWVNFGKIKGSVNSFGGGVFAIISVILKILFNIVTKRFPIIVLDEALAFLHSPEYIKNASEFLNKLSKEFQIPIFMVTQEDAFSEGAEYCYEVTNDFGKTNIVEILE